MDSDSVTMETDEEDSSMDGDSDEPTQEVWVQSASGDLRREHKPVRLTISHYVQDEGPQGSSAGTKSDRKSKGDDPTALAVLRRQLPELQHAYRILIDLMSDRCKGFAWPFMDRVDHVRLNLPDYYDRIKTPMWLTKIEDKFEDEEYTSITEFVCDVRQILENCYRYNGLGHIVSRQAQMLERHFEQKLAQLSRPIREKTYYHALAEQAQNSDPEISMMGRRRFSARIQETSKAMTPVADFMARRLQEEEEQRRKQRMIERKEELERLNKRLGEWETEELLPEPLRTELRAMWEIPAIGQFLKLCGEAMFLPEFSIFELERAFLLPQSSKLLATLFTNILTTRYKRKRVSKRPPMPYEFWQDKLRKKLDGWYAMFLVEGATIQTVARQLYISQRFFEVLGQVNPLTGRQYHDLSLYERVWIMKAMCDHLFETDYDVWVGVDCNLLEDQRPVILGQDGEKGSYLYFPHFLSTDVRIYRQAEIKEEKTKKKPEKVASPEKPKKRGRKSLEEGGGAKKTGGTPSQPSTTTPRGRGRPRKVVVEEGVAGAGKPTPSPRPAPPAKPAVEGEKKGRGRPRKNPLPDPALKRPPGRPATKPKPKPMAVVTPTRRSGRRAAMMEKAEQEATEQDSTEQEKSSSDGDATDGTSGDAKDAAMSSPMQTDMQLDDQDKKAEEDQLEQEESASDRGATEDAKDAEMSSAIQSHQKVEDQDKMDSNDTKEGMDVCEEGGQKPLDRPESTCSGAAGNEASLDTKAAEVPHRQNVEEAKASGTDSCTDVGEANHGDRTCEGSGAEKGNSLDVSLGKSPVEHAVCNGVMEGDGDEKAMHSSDITKSQDLPVCASISQGNETNAISDIDGYTMENSAVVATQANGEGLTEKGSRENNLETDRDVCLNQNQSNNATGSLHEDGPINVKNVVHKEQVLGEDDDIRKVKSEDDMEVDNMGGQTAEELEGQNGFTESAGEMVDSEPCQSNGEEKEVNGKDSVQSPKCGGGENVEEVSGAAEVKAKDGQEGMEDIEQPLTVTKDVARDVTDEGESACQIKAEEGKDDNLLNDLKAEVKSEDDTSKEEAMDVTTDGIDDLSKAERVQGMDLTSLKEVGQPTENTEQKEGVAKDEHVDADHLPSNTDALQDQDLASLKNDGQTSESTKQKAGVTKDDQVSGEESPTAAETKPGDIASETTPGDGIARVEWPPAPVSQPTPGLTPPLGEFELVCDSVQSFRELLDKFAQKEETVTVGRKKIVQPVKRPLKVVDLHKTLTAMLEDLEPLEARLTKVVHKAREKVYNEAEHYKQNPNPDQAAAEFWYEIQKPVSVIESSSVEVSSIDDDDDDTIPEVDSELDSDELSENEDDESQSDEDSDSDFMDDSGMRVPDVEMTGEEGKETGEPRGDIGEDSKREKMDLYSGVDIAGRTMRSSKRRRAQKREVVKAAKKAKRSKIQIVKGATQRQRAQVAEAESTEEKEATFKKVHEELKANLKAKINYQNPKASLMGKPAASSSVAQSSQVRTPGVQRDTGKYIRLLKHTTGTKKPGGSFPGVKLQQAAPRAPTLKVPFLEKSRPQQEVAETSAADKKTKTETFSFTIDAKVWESLKDKPEERQRMIMEQVEKMRGASGQKKEQPALQPKVNNSRNSPWFSKGGTDVAPAVNPVKPSLNPKAAEGKRKVLPNPGAPAVQMKAMPSLAPVGSNPTGIQVVNQEMPSLAPVAHRVVHTGPSGSAGGVQQQPSPGPSVGNSVSTLLSKEQLYLLLPNGQLTRGDGSLIRTRYSGETNHVASTISQPRASTHLHIAQSPVGLPCGIPSNVVSAGGQGVRQYLSAGGVSALTVPGAPGGGTVQRRPGQAFVPTAATNCFQQVQGAAIQQQQQAGLYHVVPGSTPQISSVKPAVQIGTTVPRLNTMVYTSSPASAAPITSPVVQTNPLGVQPVAQGAQAAVKGSTPGNTQGTTGGAIVLPTNLKVNCNNKQWKLVYVQKPGAAKPELCLQPCNAEGAAAGVVQGSAPVVTVNPPQQPLTATNAGRSMQIQIIPQGQNKLVMQAVQSPEKTAPPPTVSSTMQTMVVQQSTPVAPQVISGTLGQNISLAAQQISPQSGAPQVISGTLGQNISLAAQQISPSGHHVAPTVPVVNANYQAPVLNLQSHIPAASIVTQPVPAVQTVLSNTQGTILGSQSMVQQATGGVVLAGGTMNVLPNQILYAVNQGSGGATGTFAQNALSNNVIMQAAAASGLVVQPQEPSVNQVSFQQAPQGSGQ